VPPSRTTGTRSGSSRGGRGATVAGFAVSLAALAAVVWWALHQPAPQFPSAAADWAEVGLALALYATATCVRAERWRILLLDQGARPSRADMYGLTVVGFFGNNVLPARGGDVVRVLLGAPRVGASRRTVIGTLLAERLLDVVVLASLFVVLALTVAGGPGLPHGEALALAIGGLVVAAAIAAVVLHVLHRRGLLARLRDFVRPMLASTVGLRGRHGAVMLGMTAVIWLLEGGVWSAVGAAANTGMSVLDGFYVLALASMFALIPSGPGYAGTVDAATVIGIKAVGGTNATAYLVLVRFVVFVPISIVGFIVLMVRYGGRRALRLRTAPEATAS
jgi:glycosyltransferase 2 family protein